VTVNPQKSPALFLTMSDDVLRQQKVDQLCNSISKADLEAVKKQLKSTQWKAEWINHTNSRKGKR
jgi:hypothetical protein